MTIAHAVTEFKCKVCGEPLKFDIKDPKAPTYTGKTHTLLSAGTGTLKLDLFPRLTGHPKDERHPY